MHTVKYSVFVRVLPSLWWRMFRLLRVDKQYVKTESLSDLSMGLFENTVLVQWF